EHGDELAGPDGQVDAAPERPAAHPDGRPPQVEHGVAHRGRAGGRRLGAHGVHFPAPWASACWRPLSWVTCHCWNDAPAGLRVSVTVALGKPAALAAFTWAAMSGL